MKGKKNRENEKRKPMPLTTRPIDEAPVENPFPLPFLFLRSFSPPPPPFLTRKGDAERPSRFLQPPSLFTLALSGSPCTSASADSNAATHRASAASSVSSTPPPPASASTPRPPGTGTEAAGGALGALRAAMVSIACVCSFRFSEGRRNCLLRGRRRKMKNRVLALSRSTAAPLFRETRECSRSRSLPPPVPELVTLRHSPARCGRQGPLAPR